MIVVNGAEVDYLVDGVLEMALNVVEVIRSSNMVSM